MQPEDLHLDERLGQPLRVAVVVERAVLGREPQELLDELGVDDELARVDAALVGERLVRDLPAFVLRADDPVLGNEHVGEEDLVELGLVGDLAQRPHLDARVAHVDDEVGDALVLRRVGIGAGEAHAPVGELRVARPHLLAVEQPAAVGARRARREAARGRCPRWAR